jgi:acyl carrier protein
MARALPSHMLPSVCMVLASLPLTSNGKIDRRALPRPTRAGPGPSVAGADAVPTAIERKLMDIWAKVLASRQFGLDDDYFAVGGDSLGLMQIALAIRADLGVDVDSEHLFEHLTVRTQAGLVEAARAASSGSADEADHSPIAAALAALPPQVTTGLASVEQEVFWSGARAFRGWPLFNTSEVIAFTRPLDMPALQQAVDAVVARHESLRTVLHHRDSALWQTVLPAGPVTIEHYAKDPGRQQELHSIVAALAQRPLHLEQGPTVRWVLVPTGEGGSWLVLIVHHAMSDGHSMELIVNDLLAGYAALVRGTAPDEPAPGLRYLDYAARQRSRLRSGEFEAARRHWEQVLAGAPPSLRLPADLPRRAFPRWHGGREPRIFGAELRRALKSVASARNASLYMVLLTAFDVLIWEQTGQADLVVGASSAGRSAKELQRMAGCTIGSVALRVRLDPGDTYEGLLAKVRLACLDAFAHQNLPLGMVFKPRTGDAIIAGNSPLPVWLELHDRQGSWETRFADLGVERHDVDRGISESELSLEVDDTGTALVCHAQYKSGLFFAERVQSWLSRYQQLLELLVAAPDCVLTARPVMATQQA